MKNFRNKLLLFVLMLAQNFAFAQSNFTGYSITGYVKGIQNGTAELSPITAKDSSTTKTTVAPVKDGKFLLKGDLAVPEMMQLTLAPGNWKTQIFVENSDIKIIGDTIGAVHYNDPRNGLEKITILKDVKISGSVTQKVVDDFNTSAADIKTKDRKLYFDAQFDLVNQFIDKDASSVAGVYLFGNYYTFNLDLPLSKLESVLQKFYGDATKSNYFQRLSNEVRERKAILPGNLAEDFTLLKSDSTKFTLSSLRGKYVLIDFWASWCKPCREAIPRWKEIYEKYKDNGLEILGVTNDSKRKDWLKAMEEEKMPWPQVIDEFPVKYATAKVISRYKSNTIPLYVLLDKESRILTVTANHDEVEQILLSKLKL